MTIKEILATVIAIFQLLTAEGCAGINAPINTETSETTSTTAAEEVTAVTRITDFESIVIEENTTAPEERGYEILRTESGVRLSYYAFEGFPDNIISDEYLEYRVEGGSDLYEKIISLANEYGVADWNGFNESSDMLDGGGFTFRAVINGEKMRAYGSNAYPQGFFDFKRAIHEILKNGNR